MTCFSFMSDMDMLDLKFDAEVSQVPPSLPGMARAIFCISYVLFRLSECAPGMAIEVYTGHGWLSSRQS